ncbi:MAG: stage II sporulation protein M [Armatimonadota bacterium]
MATTYPEWKRLAEILATLRSVGFEKLDADEIIEFGKLYRRAASELAFHRTHEADPARVAYLNDLVGQCYPYVYTAQRRPWPSLQRFFTHVFPATLRRHAGFVLLAFGLSLLAALICFWITWHDRAVADQVLPPELMGMLDELVHRHHTPKEWMEALESAPMAGFIISNNIHVSILAFAGGMTAGLLTLFVMLYNGVMLGVVAAAIGLDGPATALNFWAFVAPHGVLELTAIFISGGAGLLMAYAMVNPGEYPRRVALRNAGKEALKLMLGVAAMLVVAGLIEGFFSPRNIPEEIKLYVAGAEAVLLVAYLFFAGRRKDAEDEAPFGTLMTPLPPV